MRTKAERRMHALFRYRIGGAGGQSCAHCSWYTGDDKRTCDALGIKVDPKGTCNAWRAEPRRSTR